MKSTRAKEFIIKYGVPTSPNPEIAAVIPRETAIALVEITEEDARNAAIQATKMACEGGCTSCDFDCAVGRRFLKYYDTGSM